MSEAETEPATIPPAPAMLPRSQQEEDARTLFIRRTAIVGVPSPFTTALLRAYDEIRSFPHFSQCDIDCIASGLVSAAEMASSQVCHYMKKLYGREL